MIKMRWYRMAADELGDHKDSQWLVNKDGHFVLQYRIFRTHRVDQARATELSEWSEDYGWTDWMDVPNEE